MILIYNVVYKIIHLKYIPNRHMKIKDKNMIIPFCFKRITYSFKKNVTNKKNIYS